ncbi:hypothetical protein [Mesorhizobium abyssinicae]|uniref:hypothetical protein n=1 Tax=Mesorhizobium abyssinicae TaxID=1209958 RepID=UPI0033907F62
MAHPLCHPNGRIDMGDLGGSSNPFRANGAARNVDYWLLVVEEKVVVIDSVSFVWRRNCDVAQEPRFAKLVQHFVDGSQRLVDGSQ